MISAVVGVYAFVPGVAEQIRYLGFLRTKVRALLLKKGMLTPYKTALDACRSHWSLAVILAHNEEGTDLDTVAIMLSEIEEVLQTILEREGLTANTKDAYRGEILLPGPIRDTSGPSSG
jgi:hypothetical protein